MKRLQPISFATHAVLSQVHVCGEDVRASSVLQRLFGAEKWHIVGRRTSVSPRKYFCKGPSPRASFCNAIYRYALNAPGSTVMYPNTDSLMQPNSQTIAMMQSPVTYKGLSKMLDILYSKFCAATSKRQAKVQRDFMNQRTGATNRGG